MHKKIAPAAIQALKEALTHVYWFKNDLRSFLSNCVSDHKVLSRLNWNEYKRNIVATLIDHLSMNEATYQNDIIRLMSEVSNITDFTHLRNLEDGDTKAKKANDYVEALRAQLKGHQDIVKEQKIIVERRKQANERLAKVDAVQKELDALKIKFNELVSSDNLQQRGFDLEKFLKQLFDLFDLDPRAAFRISGEQIDGSFSFEGTDFLLEAKWQNMPIGAKELDSLASKLARKLDNTLGLFVSINGFSDNAVNTS